MRAYEGDLDVAAEFRRRCSASRGSAWRCTATPWRWRGRSARCRASVPFEGMAELESLSVPALVVASRDEADPGHPFAVAEAWAQAIPGAELISEEPGESPLAWQGGGSRARSRPSASAPRSLERLGA